MKDRIRVIATINALKLNYYCIAPTRRTLATEKLITQPPSRQNLHVRLFTNFDTSSYRNHKTQTYWRGHGIKPPGAW